MKSREHYVLQRKNVIRFDQFGYHVRYQYDHVLYFAVFVFRW